MRCCSCCCQHCIGYLHGSPLVSFPSVKEAFFLSVFNIKYKEGEIFAPTSQFSTAATTPTTRTGAGCSRFAIKETRKCIEKIENVTGFGLFIRFFLQHCCCVIKISFFYRKYTFFTVQNPPPKPNSVQLLFYFITVLEGERNKRYPRPF